MGHNVVASVVLEGDGHLNKGATFLPALLELGNVL